MTVLKRFVPNRASNLPAATKEHPMNPTRSLVCTALILVSAAIALPGCNRESQANAWATYEQYAEEEAALKRAAWATYEEEQAEEARRKQAAWERWEIGQARDEAQIERFEAILNKWEEQAARYDRILAAMEKQAAPRTPE
jgi:hypothetical protein